MATFCSKLKMLIHNVIVKDLILLFGKHDNRNLKYKISLCLIFKNEARFLSEWLDYHRTIGIEHFYLYNNGSTDNYDEILKPYIEQDLVTLHDWNIPQGQIRAYEHCYDNYREQSNWIGFIDTDEFICLNSGKNIIDWLSCNDKFPAICLYWHMFGSGGRVEHDDNELVIEQYSSCHALLSPIGKNLFNTRFNIANWDLDCMHHWPMIYFPCLGTRLKVHAMNIFGYFASPDSNSGISKDVSKCDIKLNHYFCKAWNIYYNKSKMSDVTYKENPKRNLNYYYEKEELCVAKDYTIQNILIRLKMLRGEIHF